MKDDLRDIFNESIRVKNATLEKNLPAMVKAVGLFSSALKKNKKIIFFGNGGSAADSQHWAAELVGRFQRERKALPAIALTTDTSILTALGNDYNFEIVFARQLEALGQRGDVAVAISTSGRSPNVIQGVKTAKAMGLRTIAFTGGDGGRLAGLCDLSLIASSKNTARIQESHLCMAHAIIELVENNFK
jgi:D-sedoheptulose 7-phosphate isomerase